MGVRASKLVVSNNSPNWLLVAEYGARSHLEVESGLLNIVLASIAPLEVTYDATVCV